MAATLSHIVLRRRLWVARLTVPPDVQAIIGKKLLSKSTGETSMARAGVKAELIVAGWKKQFEEARAALLRTPGGSLPQHQLDYLRAAWKAGEHEIVEDAMVALVPEGMSEASMVRAWEMNQHPGYAARQPSHMDVMAAAVPQISAALDAITETRTLFLKHKDAWSASIRMKDRQKAQYIRDIEAFGVDATLCLGDVTRQSVRKWIMERTEAGDSGKTIQRRLSALRHYWRWLQDHDLVDQESDPWAKPPMPRVAKQDRATSRAAFTTAQVGQLWASCGDDGPLQALIALAGYTGGRIEELCTLTVADVNLTEWTMKLDSKTEAGDREVPIHVHIQPLVTKLVGKAQRPKAPTQGGPWLIHSNAKNQYGERSVSLGKRFGRLKTEAGHGSPLVFHSIRNMVATSLHDAGCPEPTAANILGHKIETMTYGVYSRGVHMATRREWLEKAISIPGIAPEAEKAPPTAQAGASPGR
jgi:integrase